MSHRSHIRRRLVLFESSIDAISWEAIIQRIRKWADQSESRYVCFCNVHSLIVGHYNEAFREAVQQSDTAAPDGMPVAWLMRKRGVVRQERIDGPSLMWRYAERAALDATPIFLYGSTDETLAKLAQNLRYAFPGLKIAGAYSPPFRPLNAEEEDEIVRLVSDSGAKVVFVGLGCPRQELWMSQISWRIPAVLIGVGAAFDFHSGVLKRAPEWMQRLGLEWLYRLCTEPRRLWRRYVETNCRFLYLVARDMYLSARRRKSGG